MKVDIKQKYYQEVSNNSDMVNQYDNNCERGVRLAE